MKIPPLKAGLLAAAVLAVLAMTSCTYDPYGNYYGTAHASYTYSNYPYGYTTSYLPHGYTSVYISGTRYWHCNNHYYRHYPGRGYVVVKRPHGHHGGYHGHPNHHKPVHYAHHRGDRYQYEQRGGNAHRGNMLRSGYPSRSQGRTYPSRYDTVRTGPSNPGMNHQRPGSSSPRTRPSSPRVQPSPMQPRPSSSTSRQVKSRPTNQSSTWSNNNATSSGTIQRNPAPFRSPKASSMSRPAPSRSPAPRGGDSRRTRF